MINFKDWKEEDLKSIKTPTFIIMGDNDVATPEHALQMNQLLQYGTLSILPGLHSEYSGEVEVSKKGSKMPELFVNWVDKFLDEPFREK